MTLSDQILGNYHGTGAYLAALDVNDNVIAIRQIPEIEYLTMPNYTKKAGRPSKADKIARAHVEADYWRSVEAARAAWAADIRNWRPAGTVTVRATDMSCTEFCGVFSDLAWAATDALENKFGLHVFDAQKRDQAYAIELRLTST